MGFRLLQITCRDVTLWRLYQQTSHCGVSTPNMRHIVASLPQIVTLWRLYPNRRHNVASLPETNRNPTDNNKGKNMKDGNLDFDEYARQGEPDKKEKASILRTAIGLQAVDGLRAPDYLKDTARKHIEGE